MKVLEIRRQNKEKSLKGFVDIELDNGIILKDFRIIQQPNHKAYVVCPQVSWRGPGGQMQYKVLVTLPDALKWQIESAILAEFQKVMEKEDGQSEY